MKRLFTQGAAAALALLMAACGGGSDHPAGVGGDRKLATTLGYTDPTGTGWRLVRQEGSTDKRIVPPEMPNASRASGIRPRWLVDSGWLSVVPSSPSDGQKGMRFAAAMNFSATARPPRRWKVTIDP